MYGCRKIDVSVDSQNLIEVVVRISFVQGNGCVWNVGLKVGVGYVYE